MPQSGEQVRGRRACEVLERGGTSAEGATVPRARRNLTRGGDWPSNEVKIRRCGSTPLERSGVPPEGGWANCSGGPLGPLVPWPPASDPRLFQLCFTLVSLLFAKESGFSLVI
jgi:hypothetical protein